MDAVFQQTLGQTVVSFAADRMEVLGMNLFWLTGLPGLIQDGRYQQNLKFLTANLRNPPMRNIVFRSSYFLAALAGTASVLAVPITPTSQNRSVSGETSAVVPRGADADNASAAAPDFAPFNENVGVTSIAVVPPNVAASQVIARQVSSIGASSIAATGFAYVNTLVLFGTGMSASGVADSSFDVVFTVSAISNYDFSGFVDTWASATGGAGLPALDNTVQFLDLDNNVTLFEALSNDEVFALAGALQPGNYRLLAFSSGEVNTTSIPSLIRSTDGQSSYGFELVLTPRDQVPVPDGGLGMLGVLGVLGFLPVLKSRVRD